MTELAVGESCGAVQICLCITVRKLLLPGLPRTPVTLRSESLNMAPCV